MKIVIKFFFLAVLGASMLVYAGTIFAHIFIEYSFSKSTLHVYSSYVDHIPGVLFLEDKEGIYCIDSAGPGRWMEKLCKTQPVRRITVQSRYMRKSWELYINDKNVVTFKNSWVVL